MKMKKFFAVVLSVSMVFGMMACGKKEDKKDDAAGNKVTEENVTPGTENPENGGNKEENKTAVIKPAFEAGSAGEKFWNAFVAEMEKNPEAAPVDVANVLVTNPVIQFMAGAVEVEPGYLAGFSEEIKDFEKAAMYAPMMGSIAFVGYIFDLAEGADVNAFVANLTSKADPRWNICVAADYTQVGAYGNTVYFLMYPSDMDNASEVGGEDMEEASIIWPDVAENSWGEKLWEAFETTMNDNPSSTAVDAAFMLSMHESIPFMAGSSEIMPGLLTGFDNNEITEFKSGAMFGPMMGSIAFTGYVFELEEGADVNAFMNDLTAKCNPAWNVCVEADQTVVGAYNNMVFFLMCPLSNEG